MTAYYNEIDGAAAHVLECLIRDGVIADGIVDRRSIIDVEPSDLRGFTQCHFFAGGGFWSVAARLAGWPDDRELWTGSCPCQPFSTAGKRLGEDDPRHLWPDFHRLINCLRPAVVLGEQVSGAAGFRWLDGVADDMEASDYAIEAFNLSACSVDAPHIRKRLYWAAMGNPSSTRLQRHWKSVEKHDSEGWGNSIGHTSSESICFRSESKWTNSEYRIGEDGSLRRVKPGIRLMVDGCAGRVALLRILGNAIVTPLAAEFISAVMETIDGA